MIDISIIIPYYKKKKFILKTVKSISNQNYNKKKYEILIIYDDINKNDLFYLKKKFKFIKNLKIIVNKKNLGAAISRNIGIKHAKGEFCAFIDADDIWKRNKLSEQIFFMKKNNYMFTFTGYLKKKNYKTIYVSSKKKLSYKNLLNECTIGLSTVIIKKKIIPKNLFPNLKTQEDFGAWLKLTKKGYNAYYYNKFLTTWYYTPNSLSSASLQKVKDLKTLILMQNIKIRNKIWFFFKIIFNSLKRKFFYASIY